MIEMLLFIIIALAICVFWVPKDFSQFWIWSNRRRRPVSQNLGEKAAISIPHTAAASQHIFAGKKWCSSRWVNRDARMHRVWAAGQPEVWWVRQCLLLLRGSPGGQRYWQSPSSINIFFEEEALADSQACLRTLQDFEERGISQRDIWEYLVNSEYFGESEICPKVFFVKAVVWCRS